MIWSIPLCYNVCCQKKDKESEASPGMYFPGLL